MAVLLKTDSLMGESSSSGGQLRFSRGLLLFWVQGQKKVSLNWHVTEALVVTGWIYSGLLRRGREKLSRVQKTFMGILDHFQHMPIILSAPL